MHSQCSRWTAVQFVCLQEGDKVEENTAGGGSGAGGAALCGGGGAEGAAVYMRRRGAKGAAVSGGALNFARIARALEPPEAAPQAAAAAPKVPP